MANAAVEPPTHTELSDHPFADSHPDSHPDSPYDDHGGENDIGLTSAEIKMLLEHGNPPHDSESELEPVNNGFVIDDMSVFDMKSKSAASSLMEPQEVKPVPPINNGMGNKATGSKKSEKTPPTKKFLFETFFDQQYNQSPDLDSLTTGEAAEAAIHIEPLPPLPPTLFSQAQLEAACARARSEGEALTRAELIAAESHQQLLLLQQLAQQIPQACDQYQAEMQKLSAEVARVAVALVAKILPDYTRQNGAAEILAFVGETIDYALGRAKLRLRIHPQNLEYLRSKIEEIAIAHGFSGKVEVVGDSQLAAADVQMDWGDGSAEKIEQRIWQAITDLVPPKNQKDEGILPPD
ncbi:MAG: FliH/SctL family protein [Candidatus Pacebacteria bacterium]|nr:FliH/SctL family protein [Candidatus Paceibacterota bacterium]